jgi:hypothetical protein
MIVARRTRSTQSGEITMRFSRYLAALCCLAMLGGCAVNRSYMRLDVSKSSVTVQSATGGKVLVIDSVQDTRAFEESPSDPSTPSLKKGDSYKLDAEQRKRAIARKRNGYGMAMGDILLEGEQTVETLTRDLVGQSFARHGYQVIAPNGSTPADALHVKITVDQFWAWFTPGMWTVDMEAKIHTLIVSANGTQLDVHAYGKNSGASAKEDNWREAYDRTFADYGVRFDEAFGRTGW